MAYMFGFQDSRGLTDIAHAVADLSFAEEQLSALPRSHPDGSAAALLLRLRFRRNLLNVSQSRL